MKTPIIIFLIILFQGMSYSQDFYLPEDNYKVQKSKEILKKIVNTYSKSTSPDLKIERKEGNMILGAECRTDELIILMNEKCFDICYEVDSINFSGLAYVLGHEYGHYFYGHNEQSDFIKCWYGNDTKAKIDSAGIITRQNDERMAEIFGIQASFVAGYDVRKSGVKVINKIYEYYKIKDNPAYPPLEERIGLISEYALKEIENYIPVYNLGIMFYLSGNYIYAAECFNHLSSKFPAKEVFNDIGVCYVLEALNCVEPAEKFIYPIEFNFNERLSSFSKGGNNKNLIEYLNTAEKSLNLAISIEPEYYTALINRICLYLIKGDLKSAEYFFYKDSVTFENIKYKDADIYSKFQNAKGIFYAKTNNNKSAAESFKTASLRLPGDNFSGLNLKVLNGDSVSISNLNENELQVAINKIKPYDYIKKNLEVPEDNKVKQFSACNLYYENTADYYVLYLKNFRDIKSACFITNNSEYDGQIFVDLSINDSKEKLILTVGNPYMTYKTDIGEFLHYKKSNAIFLIKNNLISELTIYSIVWKKS